MKNKNKLIGILIAASGVVASFATASALYVKAANKAGFGIGAEYHGASGTINYLIDNKASGTIAPQYWNADASDRTGTGLGGDFTQMVFSFPLGASFADDLPAQPYVVGNFSIKLTSINAALKNASVISIDVSGYETGKIGEQKYRNVFETTDVAIKDDSFETAKNLCVEVNGTNKVDVYIKLNSKIEGDALVALQEAKLFDISVAWGEFDSSFSSAYIISAGSTWQEDPAYAMYPNIKADSWQWMYQGLPGTLVKGKCKEGSNYSKNTGEGTDEYGNVDFNPANTYDVYWSGANDSPADFQAK